MSGATNRRRILSTVFPVSVYASSQPTPRATPQATPETRFPQPGQPFGGYHHGDPAGFTEPSSDPVVRQINWERAWHSATSFLRIPAKFDLSPRPGAANQLHREWLRCHPSESPSAIPNLLRPEFSPTAREDECFDTTLVTWYGSEVRRHFLAQILPQVRQCLAGGYNESVLYTVIRILNDARTLYSFPLVKYILPGLQRIMDSYTSEPKWTTCNLQYMELQEEFTRNIEALGSISLPTDDLKRLLGSVLLAELRIILVSAPPRPKSVNSSQDTPATGNHEVAGSGLDVTSDQGHGVKESPFESRYSTSAPQMADNNTDSSEVEAARSRIIGLLEALQPIGLGGGAFQRVFAEVMHEVMNEYIVNTFSHEWQAPSTVIPRLHDWIENRFARLVVEVLRRAATRSPLDGALESRTAASGPRDFVTLEDVQKWQEMSVGQLGRLRVSQFFDIVVEWDASMGAVQDLAPCVGARSASYPRGDHLVRSFTTVLLRRLLHPGASTMEILQVYISLIRVFAVLDTKGVLVDRVARPIRRYLRDREDTVKVIVNGLLARPRVSTEDSARDDNNADVLTDLATELDRDVHRLAQSDDDQEFDWDDMQWTPDPIDAGPDYKKFRSADVIGSLMSLFESKDVFISEFQNVICERLLKSDGDLEQEVRVLELLKRRFGEGSLQAPEVMLHDMRESKVLNRNIANDPALPMNHRTADQEALDTPPELGLERTLRAKVLSRLFWPQLNDDRFNPPAEIRGLQKQFETGFESLKPSRKLAWLNALGYATVELELADRTLVEKVPTWQASVIYAFDDAATDSSQQSAGITRSVAQLTAKLEMDENLVRHALKFWTAKRVLLEVAPDTFGVLETLEQRNADRTAAAGALANHGLGAADASPTKRAPEERAAAADDKMKVYWQFIVGMLTNAGPMEVPRILMMLNLTMPGGFPHPEKELRDFLNRMVQEDRLHLSTGVYSIAR